MKTCKYGTFIFSWSYTWLTGASSANVFKLISGWDICFLLVSSPVCLFFIYFLTKCVRFSMILVLQFFCLPSMDVRVLRYIILSAADGNCKDRWNIGVRDGISFVFGEMPERTIRPNKMEMLNALQVSQNFHWNAIENVHALWIVPKRIKYTLSTCNSVKTTSRCVMRVHRANRRWMKWLSDW